MGGVLWANYSEIFQNLKTPMNGTRAQSWNDLVVMPPMDPRGIIALLMMNDQAGTTHTASFARSTTWLNPAKTWVNPPMVTTLPGTGTTSNVVAANPYDFDAVVQATNWNTVHAMTLPSAGLPIDVQNIMFFKSDPRFINNFYVDWTGAATATDLQFSLRNNSATTGMFENSATATVPVFTFPNTATYGGTGRLVAVSLSRPGRFQVAFRIVDNSGNWSMFEMDWIVV